MPKLRFIGIGSISDDAQQRNRECAKRLGLPELKAGSRSGRLAVIGGGPSALRQIDEIRAFDGDVWAINDAAPWCVEHGINATLFTNDPQQEMISSANGIKRGVVSLVGNPDLFSALMANNAVIETFDPNENGAPSGPASATALPRMAFRAGYRHLTYFGCECSFVETTHVYSDIGNDSKIVVECHVDGKPYHYLTKPDFLLQAECLASLFRWFGDFMEDRSGGLLRAFINAEWELDDSAPIYEIIRISEKVKIDVEKTLDEQRLLRTANQGCYDIPDDSRLSTPHPNEIMPLYEGAA